MAIHIDSDGNFYFGASGTTEFDSLSYTPVFSVTKDGLLTATSGTIGGWTIGSTELSSGNISIDSTGEISANYSSSTGWKLEADGDAFFNSVDVRIDSAASATPSTGKTTLDVGNTQIYTFNNDLYLNTTGTNNAVYVKDQLILTASSSSASNMQLMFDGLSSGDAMGFWHDSDFPNSSDAELYWTNQSGSGDYNKIAYVTTQDDYFHLGSDAPGIKTDFTGSPTMYFDGPGSPGTDSALFNMAVTPYAIKDKDGQVGSSGQVLSSTGSRIDWIDLPASGGAHADSDHTSFITQSDADTRYVNESDHTHSNLVSSTSFNSHTSSSTAHGTFDNYSYWRPRINGSNISGTIGSTDSLNFVAGSNMTISEAGSGGTRNITFSSGGTPHTHTSVLSISVLDLNLYRDIVPQSSNSKRVGTSSTNRMLDVFSRDFHGGTFYGTLVNSSSQNTKTNIEDTGLGLDFIEALPVKQFNYITADHSDKKYTGVIAEDVTAILEANGWDDYYLVVDDSEKYSYNTRCSHPVKCDDSESFYCEDDCCSSHFKYTEEDGSVSNWLHHTVEECEEYEVDGSRHPHFNYYQLIGPLVKSVQELSTQISDLTARVEALEG